MKDKMELRDFAEQVLFSSDLATKLWSPDAFTDDQPGTPWAESVLPGRPVDVPLYSELEVPPSPTPASLVDLPTRGKALHSFAHHELQALELMAVALLRWPHAPKGFRRGLAHIIRDEQRHFKLYRDHAEHWGCELGEVGVGHFFWDTVAHLKTPREFLAALSLTFEQANLDFALHWKSAFAAVEDQRAVDILDEVYRDEIRHVRHGIHWFERLGGGRQFTDHAKALHFPMSPGRAKGPLFNREGRLKAGFSESYVDELELSNVSRGRPPRIFVFHPFAEDDVAGRVPRKSVRLLQDDLASLMMFLAHKEDVVLAKRPPLKTLKALHGAGFAIPQFLDSIEELGERKRGTVEAWGWSPRLSKTWKKPWSPSWSALYDKTWALTQRQRFQEGSSSEVLFRNPAVAHTELEPLLEQIRQPGNWVIKMPFSTSGQGRIRVEGAPDDGQLTWIQKQLRRGPLLVEIWANRVLDFSVQVEVAATSRVLGINRFWTNPTGNYQGAVVGKWNQGLSAEYLRFIHENRMPQLMKEAALHVAQAAHDLGYQGPLGVDAMLVQTPEGLRLEPILEINPRYTMGRIALALSARCAAPAAWLLLNLKQLRTAGYDHMSAFEDAVEQQPAEFTPTGLRRGILFTSSPSASQVVSLLVADKDFLAIQERIESLGLCFPDGPHPSKKKVD